MCRGRGGLRGGTTSGVAAEARGQRPVRRLGWSVSTGVESGRRGPMTVGSGWGRGQPLRSVCDRRAAGGFMPPVALVGARSSQRVFVACRWGCPAKVRAHPGRGGCRWGGLRGRCPGRSAGLFYGVRGGKRARPGALCLLPMVRWLVRPSFVQGVVGWPVGSSPDLSPTGLDLD